MKTKLKYLELFEYHCEFISDKIRRDTIELLMKNIDTSQNTSPPSNNSLITDSFFGGYDDQIYLEYKDGIYIYYEGWVPACWDGAYSKPIYQGLTKEEILNDVINNRFKLIIKDLGLTYITSGYYKYKGRYITFMEFKNQTINENLITTEIPYLIKSTIKISSHKTVTKKSIILLKTDITELPEIFNQITTEITGYISFQDNTKINKINTFNNIKNHKYRIEFHGNDNLTEISGFDSLIKLNDLLWINYNHDLHTINGFNKLEYINDIWIKRNIRLHTINSFNELHTIKNSLQISYNESLENIHGFNKLKIINSHIEICDNDNLKYITGFNNLTEIGGYISITNNPKLISMSIPHTLIESTKRNISIGDDEYSYSPKYFINHHYIIQDCINKFDSSIHPDIVVKQIIENLELWGEPDTITTIINHILSKGDYWDYIPESFKQYVDDHYHHLYNAKYANTGARGIAKMNTGRYLGMF